MKASPHAKLQKTVHNEKNHFQIIKYAGYTYFTVQSYVQQNKLFFKNISKATRNICGHS